MLDGMFFRGEDDFHPAEDVSVISKEKLSSVDVTGDDVFDFTTIQALRSLKFSDLMRNPAPGSLAKRLLASKTQKDVEHILSSFLKGDLVATYFNDDVNMTSYLIFRLVLPHTVAIEYAEGIGRAVGLDAPMSSVMKALSHVTEETLEQRSDVKRIFMKLQSYHPRIAVIVQELAGFVLKK